MNLQQRPNGKWRARYRDDTGKQHARHFDRKADASAWLNAQMASVQAGTHIAPSAGKTTVRAYATQWQANQLGRAATQRITDNALRIHILPAIGDRALASVRRSDVQALVTGLSATLAAGTVRNVYDVLNRVMDSAVHDRIIASTPCVRITLPKQEDGEVTPPTPQQVAAILDQIDDQFAGLVVMLAGSGLRIGEALGLDVEHVDFLRREVRVERQFLQDGSFGPPKTAKSRRVVPLAPAVVGALSAHLAAYPSSGALFAGRDGRRLTYRLWRVEWDTAAASVGYEGTTHDLRHYAASALIAGGASVKQVQVFLGHSSAAITLRVYAHLWPGDDDRTRDVMEAALAEVAQAANGSTSDSTDAPADVLAGASG
jgi:integrase